MLAQVKGLSVAAQKSLTSVEWLENGTSLCELQQLRLTLLRVIGNFLDKVEGKDTKDGKQGGRESLIEIVPV